VLGVLLFVFIQGYAQTPKNIIVMIGDGMGFNHVEACNNYYGKVREHHKWDTYRVSTYSKEGFYNSDSAYNDFNFVKKRYTDSGAAATALGTGYKTHLGVIGLNENYYSVENLTEYAELKGLSSGVVTTVPFCHATPAGFVAHVSNRGMYHTIASQMLIDSKLDVIIGCGNPVYDDNGIKSETPKYKYISEQLYNDIKTSSGMLTDDSGNKRVLQSSDGDNTPDVWTFISSVDEFKQISEGKNIPKRLFGMPQVFSTLQAGRTGTEFNAGLPDLSMLSTAALNVLSKNKEGFFLMIEGGAIDWASHDSSLVRVIEETNDFNNAVEAVIKWVEKNSSWKETLVIVTADHETGFLTNTSITTEAYNQLKEKNASVLKINNPINNNTEFKFHQQDGSYAKCDHTNSLVPLYIKGAGSALFLKRLNKYKKNGLNYDRLSGTEYLDNTDIPKLIFDMIKEND
jgi:alkaline phosphatase